MRLIDRLLPDRAPGAPSLWCRVGLHRWLGPGAWCAECMYPDVIFDPPEVAEHRMEAWRRSR